MRPGRVAGGIAAASAAVGCIAAKDAGEGLLVGRWKRGERTWEEAVNSVFGGISRVAIERERVAKNKMRETICLFPPFTE